MLNITCDETMLSLCKNIFGTFYFMTTSEYGHNC